MLGNHITLRVLKGLLELTRLVAVSFQQERMNYNTECNPNTVFRVAGDWGGAWGNLFSVSSLFSTVV